MELSNWPSILPTAKSFPTLFWRGARPGENCALTRIGVGGNPDAHREQRSSLSGRRGEPGGTMYPLLQAIGRVPAHHVRQEKPDRVSHHLRA